MLLTSFPASICPARVSSSDESRRLSLSLLIQDRSDHSLILCTLNDDALVSDSACEAAIRRPYHGPIPFWRVSPYAQSMRNQVEAAGTRAERGQRSPSTPSTTRRFPVMDNLLSPISAGTPAVKPSFGNHLPSRHPRRRANRATATALAMLSLLMTLTTAGPVQAGSSAAGTAKRIFEQVPILIDALCRMAGWECDPGYRPVPESQVPPQPVPEAIPTQASPQSAAPSPPEQAAP